MASLLDKYDPNSGSYWLDQAKQGNDVFGGGSTGGTGASGSWGEPVVKSQPAAPTSTTSSNTGVQNVDYYINEFGERVPITGPSMEPTGPSENAYSEAQRLIDEAYGKALSALDEFKATLQPGFETQKAELLGQKESQTARAREDERRKVGELTQQEQEETGKAESAIAKSRREAGEMMQGLASRFGGSTGTGMFGGEILGRQVLENISTNRAALQNVRGKIMAAQQSIKRETDLFVNNLELETNDLIAKAQQGLREALANIAGRKGQLEMDKAQMRLGALQDYQDTINSITQRNTALKNQIFYKAQDAAQRLASLTSGQGALDISTQYAPYEGWGISATGVTPQNLTILQDIQGQLSGTPEVPSMTPTGAGALDTGTPEDLTSFLNT